MEKKIKNYKLHDNKIIKLNIKKNKSTTKNQFGGEECNKEEFTKEQCDRYTTVDEKIHVEAENKKGGSGVESEATKDKVEVEATKDKVEAAAEAEATKDKVEAAAEKDKVEVEVEAKKDKVEAEKGESEAKKDQAEKGKAEKTQDSKKDPVDRILLQSIAESDEVKTLLRGLIPGKVTIEVKKDNLPENIDSEILFKIKTDTNTTPSTNTPPATDTPPSTDTPPATNTPPSVGGSGTASDPKSETGPVSEPKSETGPVSEPQIESSTSPTQQTNKNDKIKSELINFFSEKLNRTKDKLSVTINEEGDIVSIKVTISYGDVKKKPEKISEGTVNNIATSQKTEDTVKGLIPGASTFSADVKSTGLEKGTDYQIINKINVDLNSLSGQAQDNIKKESQKHYAKEFGLIDNLDRIEVTLAPGPDPQPAPGPDPQPAPGPDPQPAPGPDPQPDSVGGASVVASMLMTITVLSAPEENENEKCSIDENIKITISSKDDCESNIDGPTFIRTAESSEFTDELKKTIKLEIKETKAELVTDTAKVIAKVNYNVSSAEGIKKLNIIEKGQLTNDIKNYFSSKLTTGAECINVELPEAETPNASMPEMGPIPIELVKSVTELHELKKTFTKLIDGISDTDIDTSIKSEDLEKDVDSVIEHKINKTKKLSDMDDEVIKNLKNDVQVFYARQFDIPLSRVIIDLSDGSEPKTSSDEPPEPKISSDEPPEPKTSSDEPPDPKTSSDSSRGSIILTVTLASSPGPTYYLVNKPMVNSAPLIQKAIPYTGPLEYTKSLRKEDNYYGKDDDFYKVASNILFKHNACSKEWRVSDYEEVFDQLIVSKVAKKINEIKPDVMSKDEYQEYLTDSQYDVKLMREIQSGVLCDQHNTYRMTFEEKFFRASFIALMNGNKPDLILHVDIGEKITIKDDPCVKTAANQEPDKNMAYDGTSCLKNAAPTQIVLPAHQNGGSQPTSSTSPHTSVKPSTVEAIGNKLIFNKDLRWKISYPSSIHVYSLYLEDKNTFSGTMKFDESQNIPNKYVFTVDYEDFTFDENFKIVISSKDNCNKTIDETNIINISKSSEFSDKLKKTIDLEIEDIEVKMITDISNMIAEVKCKVSSTNGIKKLETSDRTKFTDDIKNYFSSKLTTGVDCINVVLPMQNTETGPIEAKTISKIWIKLNTKYHKQLTYPENFFTAFSKHTPVELKETFMKTIIIEKKDKIMSALRGFEGIDHPNFWIRYEKKNFAYLFVRGFKMTLMNMVFQIDSI